VQRNRLFAVASAIAAVGTGGVALADHVAVAASAQEPPPWLRLENGVSAPQFDFAQAIEETVFVETTLDTDFDGARDLVRIRISRPRETETQGYDVPVVFEHSPYRGDTGSLTNHDVDFDRMPQESLGAEKPKRGDVAGAALARPRLDLPGRLDNDYVPRGYAVVLGESIGTFMSEGCPDVGARAETLATKAVIDWLNGRAPGWTNESRTQRARADWTTGHVGMTGGSYNGTLQIQAATTGVEGLETINPQAAVTSSYDYYRANGLVVAPHSEVNGAGDNEFQGEDMDVLAAYIGGDRMNDPARCAYVLEQLRREQDRVTGDWSSFWSAREYLSRVKRVEASVFVVHGLNDWNVRTKAFAEWWYRLARYDVPRKIWLHNAGHSAPGRLVNGVPDAERAAYLEAENRWFDHWLFGVDNGIAAEPRLTIEREDGTYREEADWPATGTRPVTLRLHASSATAPGNLSAQRALRSQKQSFVDRGRDLDTDDVLIQNPDATHPNRLVYRTPPLADDVRISGTPFVTLRMSIDNRNAANLTAVLVDYGTAEPVMVTRGWLDPQNRTSISRSKPVKPGKLYQFHWDLQPDDYVFAAGHRIGLVIVSTDHDYTIRPNPGTRLTLDPARSDISLPIAGGAL
jgi:X-Pro dipeptidyl-peptidase